jgi:DNA-binding GntR family transcriptional regulator
VSPTITKLGRIPLHVRVREHLDRMINEGVYPSGSQLPSEAELAESLDVSRATLREALYALERSGVIKREQGRGTFVSRQVVPKIESRLEYLSSVWQLANRQGRQLSFTNLKVFKVAASDEVAKILQINKDDMVTYVEWCMTLDKKPVSYINDYILESILCEDDVKKGFNGSILDMLARTTNYPLIKSEAKITAINTSSEISEKLKISEGEALLVFEEVCVTPNKIPIEYSRGYYIPKYFSFEIVRRP